MLKQIKEFSLPEILANLGVPDAEAFIKVAQESSESSRDIIDLADGWTLNLATGYSPDPGEFSISLYQTTVQERLCNAPRIALSYVTICDSFSLGYYLADGEHALYLFSNLAPVYALLKEDTESPASAKLRTALAPFFTED